MIGIYNGLVQKRLRVDEAFAQIEVQLKRRHDLIPNLVNAVKGYMGFEQKVLTDVTNARAAAVAAGAQGPAQQAAAENALTGTLRSLFAVVENYPELKANQNVLDAPGAADHHGEPDLVLAPALQRHRARLQHLDRDVPERASSPGMFGFIKREFFDAEPEAANVPERRPQPELSRPSPAEATVAASTFYDQIAANRRNSFLMALLVVVLLGAARASPSASACSAVAGGRARDHRCSPSGSVRCPASATYFAGDKLVLAVSGAQAIDETSAPQLMNVVREMAIAANIPMPEVYIIDDTAPNAFATGRDPEHASIAITTGLLEKLDREELQGVIGHELSHVRNLDIRFSLVVGVMVGAIALLADFFLRFTFWGGGRSRDRDSSSGRRRRRRIFMVVAIVLAILAPIISRFIQLAVSRQREYLADASSVELTRNPYGLERALAKIGVRQGGARGRQPRRPSTCTSRTRSRSSRRGRRG